MQKLEILDAEKRARRSEVQRCGVDTLLINDIPFGVRAIQRGIEVEGIWISNPNTPELSQVASSATLVGDQHATSNSQRIPQIMAQDASQSQNPSGSAGSGTKEAPRNELFTMMQPDTAPSAERFLAIATPHPGSRRLQSTIDATPRSSLNAYVPSGTKNRLLSKGNRPSLRTNEVSNKAGNLPTMIRAEKENLPGFVNDAQPHDYSDYCHEDYPTSTKPNARGAKTHHTEASNEGKGDGSSQNPRIDHSRRPRRQRVSRKPLGGQLR